MTKPFNTSLADQLVKLLNVPRPCPKTGYLSRGAAEAHIRALRKVQAQFPDRKCIEDLNVYECTQRSCSLKPYHVGHKGRKYE
jgi:hypothetical protein